MGRPASIDAYVLCPSRDAGAIERFLRTWAGDLDEVADRYELPQYSDAPRAVYRRARDLIGALVADPGEAHAIYWRNPGGGEVRRAMLYFTDDGGLIAGLSVQGDGAATLGALGKSVGAAVGYLTSEDPPAGTVEDFRDRAASAAVRLAGGRVGQS